MFLQTGFTLVLFIAGPLLIYAQEAALELQIAVGDNAGAQTLLLCGLDPSAGDSLDNHLGEQELPPFPPTGVFEARFVGHDINLPELGEGTYSDFRNGDSTVTDTVLHELKYQVGEGSTITIHWHLPPGIRGHLSDLFDGAVISTEMQNSDSLVVANPGAVSQLILQLFYLALPAVPQLESPEHERLNVPLQPLLIWRSAKDAASYNLQLAKQPDFTELVLSDTGIVDTSYQVSVVEAGATFFWRVQAQNDRGKSAWSETWHFTVEPEAEVENERAARPQSVVLRQNYPNPFNPTTRIDYVLPHFLHVRIAVYTLHGGFVKLLVDEPKTAGTYSVVWNGDNKAGWVMPSGTYFVRLQGGNEVRVKTLMLIH